MAGRTMDGWKASHETPWQTISLKQTEDENESTNGRFWCLELEYAENTTGMENYLNVNIFEERSLEPFLLKAKKNLLQFDNTLPP